MRTLVCPQCPQITTVHAVRMFLVFPLKSYCSNIYTLAGVTKHPLSFVSLFSARYERLQGGSENVHTIHGLWTHEG